MGIKIKSKGTRSQLETVRNSYVAIMHQPVTVAQTCSQMHVPIKHSPPHLQNLPPTLAGVVTYTFYTNQSKD